MPIRPENRARYPKDWKRISREARERAGNRCEGSPTYPDCRAENGKPHPVPPLRLEPDEDRRLPAAAQPRRARREAEQAEAEREGTAG
jgi:hypothetical protein